MSQPKLFVGSSKKNLPVARIVAEGLEDCADVTVWDEDVFGLNQGYLETLLRNLENYDFAVFVLAPDDTLINADKTQQSPRDNVLFESGLFMGILGRENVFLVYDETVPELKIPTDLAGISLAGYDGKKIGSDSPAAVRRACRLIGDKIKAPRFPHLVGEWKSMYPITFEEQYPLCEETVEINAARSGISIVSTHNVREDYYSAFGRLPQERQIIGEWKSRVDKCDTRGVFVLNVSPAANYMYGYFTSPDEIGGVTFAGWILAKVTGADETAISARLKKAREMLTRITIGFPD